MPRRGEGEEVAPPTPEDPRLAVSVAYAFDGSERAEDDGAGEAAGDMDDAVTLPSADRISERGGERAPEEPAPPSGEAGDQTIDIEGEELEELQTESSRPAAAASPDAAGEAGEGGGEPGSGTPAAVEEEPPTQKIERRPATGPGVSLSALAESQGTDLGGESGGEGAAAERGDSVEIAFDEETQPPEEGPPAPKPRPRASTIALGDQDLEELMEEASPAEASGEDAAKGQASDAPAAEDDFDDRKTQQMPALTPPSEGGGGEPRLPTAVSNVEERLEEERLEDFDDSEEAGDSGEIIADDMIEEIQEGGGAPVAARADSEGEPEAEKRPDATMELTGEEAEVEELPATPAPTKKRADTAEPPPPPTSSKPAAQGKSPPPAPTNGAQKRAAAVAAVGQPQARQRRRKGKPWFEEIFDEDYLRTLPFLTPQATAAEAAFVMESLGIESGSHVLDVGCGYGRHAMELAARGYHVVGLDSSLPLLLRGADEAQRRGLTINFVHGDMREITFESQFDGAYCLFNTFGYFDDETNKKTAQNIARALKPGARFVVDVLNRDYLIGDLPSRVWWEGDGCVVLEEVEFNYFSSRIVSSRSVVFDDGRQLEQEISIRSFSLHELGKLLHAAGFRVVEISGSIATRGRFFGAQSRDIVVIAERRGQKDDK